MKRLLLTFACVGAVFFLLPEIALAQTTTGTIDGVARDADGEPLPGVAVVANSPALIRRDLTVFTNAAGYYRLPLLIPGTYEVTYRGGVTDGCVHRTIIELQTSISAIGPDDNLHLVPTLEE